MPDNDAQHPREHATLPLTASCASEEQREPIVLQRNIHAGSKGEDKPATCCSTHEYLERGNSAATNIEELVISDAQRLRPYFEHLSRALRVHKHQGTTCGTGQLSQASVPSVLLQHDHKLDPRQSPPVHRQASMPGPASAGVTHCTTVQLNASKQLLVFARPGIWLCAETPWNLETTGYHVPRPPNWCTSDRCFSQSPAFSLSHASATPRDLRHAQTTFQLSPAARVLQRETEDALEPAGGYDAKLKRTESEALGALELEEGPLCHEERIVLGLRERHARIRRMLEAAEKAFPTLYAKLSKLKAHHENHKLRRSVSTPNTSPSTFRLIHRRSKSAECVRPQVDHDSLEDADAYRPHQPASYRWPALNVGGGNQSGSSQSGGRAAKQGSSSGDDGENDHDPPSTAKHGKKSGRTTNPLYPCVFHEPGSDTMQSCSTRHDFISQLKVHHGCRAHAFFYCSKCFTKFPTKDDLKSHDHQQCCSEVCLSPTCLHFGRKLQSTCMHNAGKHGNTQTMQWQHLFRLARPGEPIPDLTADAEPDHHAPALEGVSAGTSRPRASPSPVRHNNHMRGQHGPLISEGNSGPQLLGLGNPAESSSLDVAQVLSIRQAQLRSLVKELFLEASGPSPTISELLDNMFTAAQEHSAQGMPTTTPFESMLKSNVCHLEILATHLYKWIREPESRHYRRLDQLQRLAEAAISLGPTYLAVHDAHDTLRAPAQPLSANSQSVSAHLPTHPGDSDTTSQLRQTQYEQQDQYRPEQESNHHTASAIDIGMWPGPENPLSINPMHDDAYDFQGVHFAQEQDMMQCTAWNNVHDSTTTWHPNA